MSKYRINRQCVAGRGGECCVLLETIFFLQEITFCIWPDSEPTKLLDHPKQKPRRGGCLRLSESCRKVPLQVEFFRWRNFVLLSLSLIFRQALSKILRMMYQLFAHTESTDNCFHIQRPLSIICVYREHWLVTTIKTYKNIQDTYVQFLQTSLGIKFSEK